VAIDIDAFAVLGSIAAHPAAFPDIAAEAVKAARMLATKQITSKDASLKSLRNVRKALGDATFNLILDGIPDPQIKTIVTRLDKNHPGLKTSNEQWRRRQLSALVDGTSEPAPVAKPQAEPKRQQDKKAKPEKSAEPELLNFKSAGARRKR
jgi:hypothetical protein